MDMEKQCYPTVSNSKQTNANGCIAIHTHNANKEFSLIPNHLLSNHWRYAPREVHICLKSATKILFLSRI